MGIQMHTQRGKNAQYVEAVKKMCELSFYRQFLLKYSQIFRIY